MTAAERVERAVLAVPGVAALHGGPFGGFGTYLPGRVVPGVRVVDSMAGDGTVRREVEVHVTVWAQRPAPEVAAQVRAAVVEAVSAGTVTVVVEDVAFAEEAS